MRFLENRLWLAEIWTRVRVPGSQWHLMGTTKARNRGLLGVEQNISNFCAKSECVTCLYLFNPYTLTQYNERVAVKKSLPFTEEQVTHRALKYFTALLKGCAKLYSSSDILTFLSTHLLLALLTGDLTPVLHSPVLAPRTTPEVSGLRHDLISPHDSVVLLALSWSFLCWSHLGSLRVPTSAGI